MKAYKKPPGIAVPRGFLLLGLMLAVHKELFVKPFADIVRGYFCHDCKNKIKKNFQTYNLLPLPD